MKKLILSLFLLACLSNCLTACGQKGPLYLPADTDKQTGQHKNAPSIH